jgi:hypothetical protein
MKTEIATRERSLANAKTRTVEALDALTAHLAQLRSDVEAVQTTESAEAVCASVKQALSLHTAMSMAARYVKQTVQRPGKTAIEAQLLRGDPAGVIAELFVITQLKDHPAKVDEGNTRAVDAVVRLCWPTICSKYDLPEGHPIPAGCAAALCGAWRAFGERNGTATHICHVHFAYTDVQGLSAALRR